MSKLAMASASPRKLPAVLFQCTNGVTYCDHPALLLSNTIWTEPSKTEHMYDFKFSRYLRYSDSILCSRPCPSRSRLTLPLRDHQGTFVM